MNVSGLVIGTRKSGTTWVYQNLLLDDRFCVSTKVKESGFYAGSSHYDFDEYLDLYDASQSGFLVEVDSSVCYADSAPDKIRQYSPEIKIVLIFRDPKAYLISRFIHSKRKGEIVALTMSKAFHNNEWLRDELNYEKILNRFASFADKKQLLLLPFEMLEQSPAHFYDQIINFLSGGAHNASFVPLASKFNVARGSKFPLVSKVLSNSAKIARNWGLHNAVNIAKKTGILKLLERNVSDTYKKELAEEAGILITEYFPTSIKIWQDLTHK